MTETSTSKADSDTLSSAEADGRGPDAEGRAETSCPLCHGAGFVHPVSANGTVDYSRVVACRCRQPVLEQERRGWLQRYSNLGYLGHHTFESARHGGRGSNSEGYAAAYEAAKAFASNPEGWLVLVGPLGCGKTRLACAIANERIASNQFVFYVSTPDLLDHLRGTYSPGSEIRYDDLFEQVRNATLLWNSRAQPPGPARSWNRYSTIASTSSCPRCW
jgi:DNA replication protein DnaC